jgi:hypothetical protein
MAGLTIFLKGLRRLHRQSGRLVTGLDKIAIHLSAGGIKTIAKRHLDGTMTRRRDDSRLCGIAGLDTAPAPLVRIGVMPFLQVNVSRPGLLFLFDRPLPRLFSLLGVGPVRLLPRIVEGCLAWIFFVRLFAHAHPTPIAGPVPSEAKSADGPSKQKLTVRRRATSRLEARIWPHRLLKDLLFVCFAELPATTFSRRWDDGARHPQVMTKPMT